MTFFLDTNTCIYFLKGMNESIRDNLMSLSPDRIGIPAIVKAELLYGAEKSKKKEENLKAVNSFLSPFKISPFGGGTSEIYGRIRADLEKRGEPIGPNDMIIASIVLERSGVLVTRNVKEFERVEGLRIENWWA